MGNLERYNSLQNSLPTNIALPLTALVTYAFAFLVFKQNPNLIHATVLKGLLVAWTPILIIASAIFLFCAEVIDAYQRRQALLSNKMS